MIIIKSIAKLLLGKGVHKSYAQSGEDLIIKPFLPKRKGIYVDVGCYHPILYSNTYRLYKEGWSGIVIDPNPNLKPLFSFFRPRDTFYNTAVGTSGEGEYFVFADGAYNTLDKESAKEYEKRTVRIKTVPVSIKPLMEICKNLESIDLMSVDVEGMDLQVLSTHDWSKAPRVIIVEAAPRSPVASFLEEKGYRLVGLTHLNSIFLLSHA
ncbi:MAG: FkbM family methyltransferase [Candidatus Paceibacterota bacterium]